MPEDWTRGKIRYELEKKGWKTLRSIDTAYGYSIGTLSNTLGRPEPRGEAVLSEILGVAPHIIWPSRYDASGRRLEPQPENQRKAKLDVRHRKNEAA